LRLYFAVQQHQKKWKSADANFRPRKKPREDLHLSRPHGHNLPLGVIPVRVRTVLLRARKKNPCELGKARYEHSPQNNTTCRSVCQRLHPTCYPSLHGLRSLCLYRKTWSSVCGFSRAMGIEDTHLYHLINY